jgi:hypothetical protein
VPAEGKSVVEIDELRERLALALVAGWDRLRATVEEAEKLARLEAFDDQFGPKLKLSLRRTS